MTMETTKRVEESKSPSPKTSPKLNENIKGHQIMRPSCDSNTQLIANPFPTTFVRADTSNFKQVVQMLTGSTETAPKRQAIPPIKSMPKKQQQQSFKHLYERRNIYNNLKTALMINTLSPHNKKQQDILSPSLLDFPNLTLASPVTPLNIDHDPLFNNKSILNNNNNSMLCSMSAKTEEERAIAEKRFYLHPSPMSTPRETEPQLLPLFPETSPTDGEREKIKIFGAHCTI